MIRAQPSHLVVILASFAAALMFTLLPLPQPVAQLRPDWVALVLIYWVVALPHRVGVGTGWLAGLFQDAATGTLLGQHALGLAVVAWVVLGLHRRIRNYPVWQQAIFVLMVIALLRVLGAWVLGISGRPADFSYWLPAVSSMFVWPLIYLALRYVRRRFGVE